jgi:hypothetical protein
VYCERATYHHRYGKNNHHATVMVNGVSLTNVLLHGWQAVATTAFCVVPCVGVMAVGTVALWIKIVKS